MRMFCLDMFCFPCLVKQKYIKKATSLTAIVGISCSPLPKFIDPVFAKTSSKRSFSILENERVGLVFVTLVRYTERIYLWFEPFFVKEKRRVIE
jgi:hypothetical protein